MSNLGEHPSFLALDRASLGLPAPHLQVHLARCSACRSYLTSLQAPVPPQGLEQVRQRVMEQKRAWKAPRKAWLAVVPMLAAVAALVVSTNPQPSLPEQPLYIGDKGFTSVWIYVKHGANTVLWDGRKPIFAGDRLRLKVDPGKFERLEVYSTKSPSSPELLYASGLVAGRSLTLPEAWEVDAEPGDEKLLVVLSHEAVKPIWSDWLRGKAQPGVMLMPFILPKSALSTQP